METILAPLQTLKVTKFQIPACKGFPNTSLQHHPVIIYHSAFVDASASQIESHLESVGAVKPHWRYTMYSETHFHSTTHEVLAISSGSAKCCFGGEQNPDRIEPVLEKGDVIVLPAGVAHRLLEDLGGFEMVGSYPPGKSWDMCYGKQGEEEKVRKIGSIPWFTKDPIYDEEGPALEV
jgi:uncharacterized protein YjlB